MGPHGFDSNECPAGYHHMGNVCLRTNDNLPTLNYFRATDEECGMDDSVFFPRTAEEGLVFARYAMMV